MLLDLIKPEKEAKTTGNKDFYCVIATHAEHQYYLQSRSKRTQEGHFWQPREHVETTQGDRKN